MNEQMEIAVIPAQQEQEQNNAPLIKLVQLPIIEERLRDLKPYVQQRVAAAMAMPCTEETVSEVKNLRAELNALATEAENRRKEVKKAIEAPYKQFQTVYDECIGNLFKEADKDLKGKIDAVENGMKEACEAGLRKLFGDLVAAHHLEWLQYERAGIKVSLTDAKAKTQPPKKLRDALTQFVERVAQDVDMILSLPDANEIMVEYRQTLNAPVAIQTVNLRHQRMAEAEAERARRDEARKQEQEAAARVAEAAQQFEAPQPVQFAPPVAVQEPEPPVQEIPVVQEAPAPEVYTVKFAVSGTLDQLLDLKRFMENGGYTYTDIE